MSVNRDKAKASANQLKYLRVKRLIELEVRLDTGEISKSAYNEFMKVEKNKLSRRPPKLRQENEVKRITADKSYTVDSQIMSPQESAEEYFERSTIESSILQYKASKAIIDSLTQFSRSEYNSYNAFDKGFLGAHLILHRGYYTGFISIENVSELEALYAYLLNLALVTPRARKHVDLLLMSFLGQALDIYFNTPKNRKRKLKIGVTLNFMLMLAEKIFKSKKDADIPLKIYEAGAPTNEIIITDKSEGMKFIHFLRNNTWKPMKVALEGQHIIRKMTLICLSK
jgi:hypothetical protein